MKLLRLCFRRGLTVASALAGWLALHGMALAQQPEKQEAPKLNSSTMVIAYIVVIFGVALGVLVVCKSSNRRDRAKPEQFGETTDVI
jgi:heme/copper-type cytochrome/quinol oxidase subunit 2